MTETDGSAAARTHERLEVPVWAAVVAAGVLCLVAYAVLREPEWRAVLMALAPHRADTADFRLRSVLAPRSIGLAGAGALAACGVALVVPAARRALCRRLVWTDAGVVLVCVLHLLLAVGVAINLLYYFPRQYGRPLWSVSRDEVLSHVLPQAWPDVKALRGAVGREARIAFRPPAQDQFFLPALGYPLEFYAVWPSNEDDWRSDAEFARCVRQLRLTHLLRYEPHDRESPLRLRKLD